MRATAPRVVLERAPDLFFGAIQQGGVVGPAANQLERQDEAVFAAGVGELRIDLERTLEHPSHLGQIEARQRDELIPLVVLVGLRRGRRENAGGKSRRGRRWLGRGGRQDRR